MPIVAPNNTDMWPSLIESHNQSSMASTTFEEEERHQQQEEKHHREDETGWEMITSTSIHRCVSTPNLSSSSIALLESSTEDDRSSDHSSFVELAENDTSIIVDQDTDCDGFVLPTPPHSPNAKPITAQSRTPSFRDAILLNASERQREEEMKREEMERREAEERLKQKRRSRGQRRIVVVGSGGSERGMKRCAKSTGDLRMMVKIEEGSDCGGGGGGWGLGDYGIIEEEVLGETDASDYYDRKSAGRMSRKNGMKLRPDEAKRKAGIVAKKNAQRRGQGQKKEDGKRNRR